MIRGLLGLFLSVLFVGCSKNNLQKEQAEPRFKVLEASETGLNFRYGTTRQGLVEGAGVGIGDFNNDGLPDIFFVGDSVHALFINEGGLRFKNVFDSSGIPAFLGGSSVTIWDFNEDGLDDILVFQKRQSVNPLTSWHISTDHQQNSLHLFQNVGELQFKNVADDLNLIDTGNFSGCTLIDFDKNGTVDIMASEWFLDFSSNNNMLPYEGASQHDKQAAKLFRKIGDQYSKARPAELLVSSAKLNTSYSLFASHLNDEAGVSVIITNDFDEGDYRFSNSKTALIDADNTTSFFSMGIDVSDINNDLKPDILVTDMRPSSNLKQKSFRFDKPYNWEMISSDSSGGIETQAVRNTVNLNTLEGDELQEVGQMLGLDATDWSWSVLAFDFNNDGQKDVFISNGYYFQDLMSYDAPLIWDSISRSGASISNYFFSDTITNECFVNKFFLNRGDLQTEGLSIEVIDGHRPLNSRGAAYADFDRDGDLDLVVSNYYDNAVIYQNLAMDNQVDRNSFLQIQLIAKPGLLLHSQVFLFNNEGQQYQEIQPVRGFYSTSEKIAHFGLGTETTAVDSVWIHWADGYWSKLNEVSVNQLLRVNYDSIGKTTAKPNIFAHDKRLFEETALEGLEYEHIENDFVDYAIDPLLPQLYSREGPGISVGDLDSDGDEDIVITGAFGQATRVFRQNSSGSFIGSDLTGTEEHEDVAIAILDFDRDGLNDILVASGGNEQPTGEVFYQHRLYRNIGNGQFEPSSFPNIRSSSTCVKVSDFNSDGWPDVFIGGRITPQAFEQCPKSYLLLNRAGNFEDVSNSWAPDLEKVGMVTSAEWVDVNADGRPDLMVVGEYMRPRLFINSEDHFSDASDELLLELPTGYWYSVASGDFNEDGRPDFVLGNLGLNTRYKASPEYPLIVYNNDFDENGSVDIISTFYENESQYTVKNLESLKPRINGFSKKFYRTEAFAQSDIKQIFGVERISESEKLVVENTASILLLSTKTGTYVSSELPRLAQTGPIRAIIVGDLTEDDHQDILVAGNFYHSEVERGRYTAMKGLLLEGNGLGQFNPVSPRESGFVIPGETRSMAELECQGESFVVAARNSNTAKVFSVTRKGQVE